MRTALFSSENERRILTRARNCAIELLAPVPPSVPPSFPALFTRPPSPPSLPALRPRPLYPSYVPLSLRPAPLRF